MIFGASGEVPTRCEIVNVCMSVRGGETRHTAQMICEPLACQPISVCQANFKHLTGLPLADKSDGKNRLEVNILISSDLYWSPLTGKGMVTQLLLTQYWDGPCQVLLGFKSKDRLILTS
jgi:hypothetical protein